MLHFQKTTLGALMEQNVGGAGGLSWVSGQALGWEGRWRTCPGDGEPAGVVWDSVLGVPH